MTEVSLLRAPESSTEFMSIGYSLIQEPLNLREAGQSWFRSIYNFHPKDSKSHALLLGAVDWMAQLLIDDGASVCVLDSSSNMLQNLRRPSMPHSLTLMQGNWNNLPDFPTRFSHILGDNSITYLKFPNDWERIMDELADRMNIGGRIMIRFFSVPSNHRKLSYSKIASIFINRESINFTELRTTLLFSHWDPATFQIDTESALRDYEDNFELFEKIIRSRNARENDLETIRKYCGTGAVYYAPPLPDALKLFSKRFRISAVHYGNYALADYFPLIVAYRV